jgi:biopolymer transport protein TolR
MIRRRQQQYSAMASINVTPFVDVTLTLLVIFMVVAPALHQGLNVQLPKTQSKGTDVSGKWVVTISDKGQIYLNERPTTMNELSQRMQAISQSDSALQVFIVGDKRSDYGTVIKVLDIIKQSGVQKVGIVTEYENLDR